MGGTSPNLQIPLPAQPTSANPIREEAETPPQNPLQARLDESRESINKQNGSNLTIQLMAVQPEALESELERIQKLTKVGPEQLFVYSAMANKKLLITIAFGVFPSAVEARAALAKLPAMYRQSQPLLRTFKSISEGIEKSS